MAENKEPDIFWDYYMKLPPTPKKKGKWIWILIAILIIGGIIGAITVSSNTKEKTTTKPIRTEEKQETNATKSPTTTQTKQPTQVPSPQVDWQIIFQDSGVAEVVGDKNTKVFHVGGGQKKLTYTVTGYYPLLLFSVTVKPAGYEEYVPSVTGPIGHACYGEVPLNLNEGDYYLKIQASYCTWQLTVQELK